MLGIKNVKIQTKSSMTLEEFYNAIKDAPFGEAGTPGYVKHGFGYVIAFPQIDEQNQVWITGKGNKFLVQRSAMVAGIQNMIVNDVKADIMNEFSLGITGVISQFGSPQKTCLAMVDKVADVINALGL
ncbi:MAG: hypothetical protein Q4E57_07670 [Eubacteriales bacterium]|nr:hypothetical protein [Eubacteriales bacterium]